MISVVPDVVRNALSWCGRGCCCGHVLVPVETEHGRVVPAGNYRTAHVHGAMTVHDDVAWLEDLVRWLTEQYVAGRAERWSVAAAAAE